MRVPARVTSPWVSASERPTLEAPPGMTSSCRAGGLLLGRSCDAAANPRPEPVGLSRRRRLLRRLGLPDLHIGHAGRRRAHPGMLREIEDHAVRPTELGLVIGAGGVRGGPHEARGAEILGRLLIGLWAVHQGAGMMVAHIVA